MSGAEWICEKLNTPSTAGVRATVESDNVIFLERDDKPSAYVGVVPTDRANSAPLVTLGEARSLVTEKPDMAMMIAIPRGALWSGAAMSYLQSAGIAFGGVGDLLSAMGRDEELSNHRNKTLAFVDDGLRRHSRVKDLEWIDSKKVRVVLRNHTSIVVALEDAYDITMSVARDAARAFGPFDVLLKTNPNGSITSQGSETAERLGFETLKWGELFGYLAKRGGRASYDDLAERLRRSQ